MTGLIFNTILFLSSRVSEALIYGAWMLAEALSFAPNFAAARRSGARIILALQRTPLVQTESSAVEDASWVRYFWKLLYFFFKYKC